MEALSFKFFLSKQRAALLLQKYNNQVAIGEADQEGICEVRVRIDDGSDVLNLIKIGITIGARDLSDPLAMV